MQPSTTKPPTTSALSIFASSFEPKFDFSDPAPKRMTLQEGQNPFSVPPSTAKFSFASTSEGPAKSYFKSPPSNVFTSPAPLESGSKSQGLVPTDPSFHSQNKDIPQQVAADPFTTAPNVSVTASSSRSSATFSFSSSLVKASNASSTDIETAAVAGNDQTFIDGKGKDIQESTASKPSDADHKSKESSKLIPQLNSIVCKNIPPDLMRKLNKDALFKHFSQYGVLTKVTLSQKNMQAIIQFNTHASAEMAKRLGAKISPAHDPLHIFWCHQRVSRKRDSECKKKLSENPEVAAELQAMLEGVEDHVVLPHPKNIPSIEETRNTTHKETHKSKSKPKKSSHSNRKTPVTDIFVEDSEILQQVPITAEERFSLLDARDKLIRQNVKKQSDLATAKDFHGTCKDMCPEKERYGRFAKKCLSMLEQRSMDIRASAAHISNLEHRFIIKEYSRSSADQEEPLPHDLRPPMALNITMNYLLCNIMDKPNVPTGEWYDFIWNRTRAIRKDITQQHLCDTVCVEIVEKCARFHIHCASALCDEDMAVFDPRINDENLTKCLQTLKHMYQDLAEKNVLCPNESEFRAYDILLSLIEGDTLRHVQKLRVEVRNTPKVQFAVKVALAFMSSNYVRFFELVEQASYLNACVLHRYFTQVRVQSVQIILKAFCAPNRTEMYPIIDLCRILKFDDEDSTAKFCQMLGFQVKDQCILLDRMAFVAPISTFTPNGSLIEKKKRYSSVGQIINLGWLPENPLLKYSPHSSFDNSGHLKPEAIQALDQSESEKVEMETIIEVARQQPAKSSISPFVEDPKRGSPQPGSSNFADKLPAVSKVISEAQNISSLRPSSATVSLTSSFPVPAQRRLSPATFVRQQQQPAPATATVATTKPAFKFTSATGVATAKTSEQSENEKKENMNREIQMLLNDIVENVLKNELISIAKSALESEKRFVLKKKQSAVAKHKFLVKTADVVLKETMADMLKSLVRKELTCAQAKRMENVCHSHLEKLVEEGITELIRDIASQVHHDEKRLWVANLKDIKRKLNLLRAKKAILKWQKVTKKRRKLEACRNSFPSCPPLMSAKQQLNQKLMFNSPTVYLATHKQATKALNASALYQMLKEEIAWHPCHLGPLFEKSLALGACFPRLTIRTYFWKLLLLIEEGQENYAFSMFTRWLCSKFTKGYVKQDITHNTFVCSLYWLMNSAGEHIAVCVRTVLINETFDNTLRHLKENSYLNGTCSIMLCLQKSSLSASEPTRNVCTRVSQLLKAKPARSPSVPLYCFTVGDEDSSAAEVHKFLDSLVKHNLVKDYQMSSVRSEEHNFDNSSMLLDATEWLLLNCPPFPEVVTMPVKNFVQNSIVAAFDVIYKDLSHRTERELLPQDPHFIATFVNNVMAFSSSVLTSHFLNGSPLLIPEVMKATGMGQSQLLVKSASEFSKIEKQIKAIQLPTFDLDPCLVGSVHSYAQQMVSVFRKNSTLLVSNIKYFLDKASRIEDKENSSIPWADIMYECTQYAEMSLDISDSTEIQYVQEEFDSLDFTLEWQKVLLSSPHRSWKKKELLPVCSPKHEVSRDSLKRKREESLDSDLVHSFSPKPKSDALSQLRAMLLSEKEKSNAFLGTLQLNMSGSVLETSTEVDKEDLGNFTDVTFTELSEDSLLSDSSDLFGRVKQLKLDLENEKRASRVLESSLKGFIL